MSAGFSWEEKRDQQVKNTGRATKNVRSSINRKGRMMEGCLFGLRRRQRDICSVYTLAFVNARRHRLPRLPSDGRQQKSQSLGKKIQMQKLLRDTRDGEHFRTEVQSNDETNSKSLLYGGGE